MSLRPNVWFAADFPDDTVYDEDGNELQFAGPAVARAVADLLRARGYRVDEPENEMENGWSLDAYRQKQRFWMQVTLIDAEGRHSSRSRKRAAPVVQTRGGMASGAIFRRMGRSGVSS